MKNRIERAYKAGMTQGFRILQGRIDVDLQEQFGFSDADGVERINARLESEYQQYLKDISHTSEGHDFEKDYKECARELKENLAELKDCYTEIRELRNQLK